MRMLSTLAFAACLAYAAGVSGSPAQSDEPKSGVIVTVPPEAQDRVADEAGEIYTTRGYKGVVPGIRDQSDVPSKKTEGTQATDARAIVEWVGFQPFTTYSRVFVQVSGAYTFAVTRPAQDRIEVRVHAADVSSVNDMHELLTRNFPTAVDKVTVETSPDDGGSVVITVFLKASVGYLYRQDGAYIFVDVEL